MEEVKGSNPRRSTKTFEDLTGSSLTRIQIEWFQSKRLRGLLSLNPLSREASTSAGGETSVGMAEEGNAKDNKVQSTSGADVG